MRDVGKIAFALLVVGAFVGLISISPAVSGHSGGFYTIMLRPDSWSEEIQPAIARISQNDSAVWRNVDNTHIDNGCLLYTSPSPRHPTLARMPSYA